MLLDWVGYDKVAMIFAFSEVSAWGADCLAGQCGCPARIDFRADRLSGSAARHKVDLQSDLLTDVRDVGHTGDGQAIVAAVHSSLRGAGDLVG